MKRISYLLVLLCAVGFTAMAQSKVRLPSPINSPKHIEYAPSITADGQTLIYQSDQYGIYINSAKKVPDISADGKGNLVLDEYEASFFGVYEAKLHPSGEWRAPKQIAPINEFANENMTPVMGGPSISYDGNELYFFANFGKNGYGREDIYYSERTKEGWTKPKNIGSTINSDGYEGFPSISPDGKKLYFTREILGKKVNDKQCYRIMVADKNRLGNWRRPIELPAPVNMDCEKAPRILADGKTLVYSSIKKDGRGDFDLYKSELQADGSWSNPVNLEFINTKKSDLFVSVSPCGDLMYMVSDGDIFTSTIPESLRPVKSATIQGYVKDSITSQPIKAKIIVKNKDTDETISVLDNNPSDGRYTAIVPFGGNYELSVNLPEFFTKTAVLTSDKIIDCELISMDMPLQKIPTDAAAVVAMSKDAVPAKQPETTRPPVAVVEKPVEAKPVVQNPTPQPEIPQKTIQKADEPVISKPPAAVAIEEMELIADTPETSKEKLEAEGEKVQEAQLITKYALIIKIVDKETGMFVPSPNIRLEKNGEASDLTPDTNGNDYIFKVDQGDVIKIMVDANEYLTYKATMPAITSDRKVTVKLAPILPSSITVTLADIDTGKPIDGKLVLQGNNTESSFNTAQGLAKIPLTKSGKIKVTATVPGYLALTEDVDVILPEEGNKLIDLNLKLVRDEYILNLSAKDIETGLSVSNAVFYVFDETGNRVLELLADTQGNAQGKLQKNGKYKVQLLADGFKNAEQNLDNLLATTQVLFKAVAEKAKTHELKITVRDRFTEEELYPEVKIGNVPNGNAPFFINGEEGQKFSVAFGGENIKPESHEVVFDQNLINRVSTELPGQKLKYEFSLKTLDAETNKIIARPALKMVELKSKQEVQEADGPFMAVYLDPTLEYTLLIEQDGYETYSQKINALEWVKSLTFERDIKIKPIPAPKAVPAEKTQSPPVQEVIASATFGELTKGKKITLENIYFDQSSPVLREESYIQLDELVSVLKDNPSVSIEIRGHTDNAGDFYLNVKLSKERCESVINYLKKQGIKGNRLTAVGRGPVEPIAPNDSEENRKKNRRVEFIVQ